MYKTKLLSRVKKNFLPYAFASRSRCHFVRFGNRTTWHVRFSYTFSNTTRTRVPVLIAPRTYLFANILIPFFFSIRLYFSAGEYFRAHMLHFNMPRMHLTQPGLLKRCRRRLPPTKANKVYEPC